MSCDDGNDARDDGAIALCPGVIEEDIIRAYLQLLFTPPVDRRRTITLGWLGTREVRLTKVESDMTGSRSPPYWVEIFCHATNTTLGQCGCFEFDRAELEAAICLVLDAVSKTR